MAQATQVRLVNSVAAQFAHLPAREAAAAVASHVQTFWDPRMRADLLAALDDPDAGLDPVALEAARLLPAG